MEKSMVQQLSILTHSTVFSSRPSFIHDPDRPELRRSRIQNLPGYRKEDLSAKLNFVVVFQTIQIQRLTQQVQTLRIMAKDADRQRLNFENYQVQIRELTQRCHSYEVHREDLQDELQRMKVFCSRLVQQLQEQNANREQGLREKYQMERSKNEQLQSELDRWRNRYSGLELARAKELEQVRQEFESRRRSQISRETRQLTIKHQNQVAVLSSELRKAREEMQMRASDVAHLQQLMGKFQMREEELREVEQKMYEYENRFVLLSQENYRLNEMLRKRSEDLDRARREGNDFKAKADSRVCLEQELTRLQSTIQEKTVLIGDLQRQLRTSSEQKDRLVLECQKGQEYVRLVDQMQKELQRINGVLREKVNEGDQLQTNQRILESKLSASTAATQKQFAAYEERIISYTRDQERLSAQLKHRLAENEQLKVRCIELQRASLAYESLREENENLRGQLGQYNNKMEQFKRKIKLHEQNLFLMDQIQQKLRNEEQVKRQLMMDRQKLNAVVRQLTLRTETATQKAQMAQESLTKLTGLEAELRECRQRLGWMTQQLDGVNNEIQVRVGQLHQVRQNMKSLGNSKANYQGIEQKLVQNLAQMEQLVLELDQNRRENDRLINDNMNMETNIRNLQGKIITLHDQRDDRNRLFNAQAVEMQELRQKIEFYSKQIKGKQLLEQTIQEQQKKMDDFKAMYAQIEERMNKETAQSEAMVFELMQIRAQPRVSKQLSEQLVTLRRQADDQRFLIGQLVKRIQVMHGMMKTVRERYGKQIDELSNIKIHINQLMNSSNCIDDIFLMLNSFGDRMDCLRQEKYKLQSEKTLVGVEYCQSYKVIQQTTVNPPQQSIKNSSIAFKVSSQDVQQQQNSNYVFTFKEVHRQSSLGQQDTINQRRGRQENEAHSSNSANTPDDNSMASSFINTLITKESTARFDLKPIQTENTAFGYNANSKLRYLLPNREQYHQQQRQIQNLPVQINRAVSPTAKHLRGFFQNAGIKRVVSYTHFAPTLAQGSQLYPSFQSRDSPSPSVARGPQSPNTVNSTSDYSQFGKRIRIPVDPARVLAYRQQH